MDIRKAVMINENGTASWNFIDDRGYCTAVSFNKFVNSELPTAPTFNEDSDMLSRILKFMFETKVTQFNRKIELNQEFKDNNITTIYGKLIHMDKKGYRIPMRKKIY